MEQKRDGQLTSEEQQNIMSELELDALKKKQDELLGNEYEQSFLGGTGGNNVGLTMAELQERTLILEKELSKSADPQQFFSPIAWA